MQPQPRDNKLNLTSSFAVRFSQAHSTGGLALASKLTAAAAASVKAPASAPGEAGIWGMGAAKLGSGVLPSSWPLKKRTMLSKSVSASEQEEANADEEACPNFKVEGSRRPPDAALVCLDAKRCMVNTLCVFTCTMLKTAFSADFTVIVIPSF